MRTKYLAFSSQFGGLPLLIDRSREPVILSKLKNKIFCYDVDIYTVDNENNFVVLNKHLLLCTDIPQDGLIRITKIGEDQKFAFVYPDRMLIYIDGKFIIDISLWEKVEFVQSYTFDTGVHTFVMYEDKSYMYYVDENLILTGELLEHRKTLGLVCPFGLYYFDINENFVRYSVSLKKSVRTPSKTCKSCYTDGKNYYTKKYFAKVSSTVAQYNIKKVRVCNNIVLILAEKDNELMELLYNLHISEEPIKVPIGLLSVI